MSKQIRGAVIGSGFGGIAAAIRLQAAGVQTTLFEAHDQPGGVGEAGLDGVSFGGAQVNRAQLQSEITHTTDSRQNEQPDDAFQCVSFHEFSESVNFK